MTVVPALVAVACVAAINIGADPLDRWPHTGWHEIEENEAGRKLSLVETIGLAKSFDWVLLAGSSGQFLPTDVDVHGCPWQGLNLAIDGSGIEDTALLHARLAAQGLKANVTVVFVEPRYAFPGHPDGLLDLSWVADELGRRPNGLLHRIAAAISLAPLRYLVQDVGGIGSHLGLEPWQPTARGMAPFGTYEPLHAAQDLAADYADTNSHATRALASAINQLGNVYVDDGDLARWMAEHVRYAAERASAVVFVIPPVDPFGYSILAAEHPDAAEVYDSASRVVGGAAAAGARVIDANGPLGFAVAPSDMYDLDHLRPAASGRFAQWMLERVAERSSCGYDATARSPVLR